MQFLPSRVNLHFLQTHTPFNVYVCNLIGPHGFNSVMRIYNSRRVRQATLHLKLPCWNPANPVDSLAFQLRSESLRVICRLKMLEVWLLIKNLYRDIKGTRVIFFFIVIHIKLKTAFYLSLEFCTSTTFFPILFGIYLA